MTTPGSVPGVLGLKRRVDEITLEGKQRPLLDSASLQDAPGVTFIDAYTIFVRYNASAARLPLNGGASHQLADLPGTVRPSTGVHVTAGGTALWAGLINPVDSDGGKIEFISARTGERRVVDVPFRCPLGASPEWTPDGRELIVVCQPRGEETLTLYRVPVDGGAPRVIAPIGAASDGWTSVSPDGALVAYGLFDRQ